MIRRSNSLREPSQLTLTPVIVTGIVLTTTFPRRVIVDLIRVLRVLRSWYQQLVLSSATYASGGNYGNYIEIKDEKGNVISRTGHGDTRFGPKSTLYRSLLVVLKVPPTETQLVFPSQVMRKKKNHRTTTKFYTTVC